MFRIVSIATAATLLVAGAANAQVARVPYGDLDLTTRSGADTFDRRARQASNAICAKRLGVDRLRCADEVADAARAELPAKARRDYAEARRSIDI